MKILIAVYNWYTNSLIFENWFLIAIILLSLTLISEFIFNKPESQILHFWKLIKVLDQKSRFIYEKRDSSNPARLNTISNKSNNKNITQKIKLFK
jgi:hypothetical protein